MKEKFVGKNVHRIKDNPRERIFSKAWEQENRFSRESILRYMLSEDGGKTLPEISERDEMIAATVFQWLGSPVGWRLLKEVEQQIEKIAGA